MRITVLTTFSCALLLSCGQATSSNGNTSGTPFGAAGAQWDINFSSARGTLTSSGRSATFTIASDQEARALNGYDPVTFMYGPIDCRRTVSRSEIGLTYANDSSRFIGTITEVRQYEGAGCVAAGYTPTSAPQRRTADGFSVVRTSSTASSFGELGGAWQILDARGRIVCNLTVSGSSFNGQCNEYTFQGVLGGTMVAGTDSERGSFTGTQR